MVREDQWTRLPTQNVQVVEVLNGRRLLTKLTGFDHFFADHAVLGGWWDDPERFRSDAGTPPMDPPPRLIRQVLREIGVPRSVWNAIPGTKPGLAWSITDGGELVFLGPIDRFPAGTVPPLAVGVPRKRTRALDEANERALGHATRWREWLAREGRG